MNQKNDGADKPEEYITAQFTVEELRVLIGLLSISAQTFEKLALDAAKANDDKSFSVFEGRYKMCYAFAHKFNTIHNIGEPATKAVH